MDGGPSRDMLSSLFSWEGSKALSVKMLRPNWDVSGGSIYLGWGHRSRRKRTGFSLPVSLVVCVSPSVLLPLESVCEVPV